LHRNKGNLFPYGFTYIKIQLTKHVTQMPPAKRKEAAKAAAELAQELERMNIAKEDKQKTKLRKEVVAQVASLAASAVPKRPGSVGGKASGLGAGGFGLAGIVGGMGGALRVGGGRKAGVSKPVARKGAGRAHAEPEEYWSIKVVKSR
jgi:hypothetical protein